MKHIQQLLKDKVGASRHDTQDIATHLRAAADWLLVAQKATPDDGVAHSFDIKKGKWTSSYPETTGYVIPTLYDYARYYQAPQYAEAAERMTAWESDIQMPDGGVRAGTMDADPVVSTIFNTGQVLFGWARAYLETNNSRYKESLIRASDWLVSVQDPDGAWRKFSSPFSSSKISSYNTRTAFGLVRASQALNEPRYLEAAVRNVNWTMALASANAWLPDNCLLESADKHALTHTIAYSIRGILEVGVAAKRQDCIERAVKMAKAVAAQQRADGALPGLLDTQWLPAAKWTCVTGNSQMAINWLRLAKITQDKSFIEHARKANRFNMSIQNLQTMDPKIRGAMKGSHPINGIYMSYRYPNWATKFFMDGLMLEQQFDHIDNIG